MVNADYNDKNYDYTKYWAGREYENASEFMALEKLLSPIYGNIKGNSAIDIGGGFGRLLPILKEYFEQVTIYDFSNKLLEEAKNNAQKLGVKLNIIEGDVNKISSLTNEKYNCALMIRVSHHLDNIDQILAEIYKIVDDRGIFILEIANKVHFKAVMGNLFKLNFKFFNHESISRTFKDTTFLNHHPRMIENTLRKYGYKVEKKLSVSNYRIPRLKKLLPLKALILLESMSQSILGYFNFGPSIIYRLRK